MVGSAMFNFLDLRLQQIMGTKEPFGGISIITVGDLFQLPLRPSAAKTIHRCQGDTLSEAVVDLPSLKREHMHYVALSRLRSILGLHILNLNKKKIAVSKKVQEEMTRLRQNSILKSHLPFLYKDTNETFTVNYYSKM